MLACVSHSPILMIRARAPRDEPEILAHYARCAAAIRAFDPEVVVIFGCDHYAGFHLSLMPSFCVGLAAEAVGDVGGFPGRLGVPREAALGLVQALRAADFDPAVSHRMRVDHGFSQPLHRLLGALDARPVIPVFIDVANPPLARFARTRRFGEAAGRWAEASGKRVLFIGSGGMSHHPTRYYPLAGTATPDVAAWQMDGAQGGSFTDAQWFKRLLDMHLEGAQMLVNGSRTAADIRLNPEFDRGFMDALLAGRLEDFDGLVPEDMLERSGVGSLELHTWVAAAAAEHAAGGAAPRHSIYAPTLEYGIGYGMAYT
jgi:2,3-dihydroxyphenylpropionate 1,2-dioxygenase